MSSGSLPPPAKRVAGPPKAADAKRISLSALAEGIRDLEHGARTGASSAALAALAKVVKELEAKGRRDLEIVATVDVKPVATAEEEGNEGNATGTAGALVVLENWNESREVQAEVVASPSLSTHEARAKAIRDLAEDIVAYAERRRDGA